MNSITFLIKLNEFYITDHFFKLHSFVPPRFRVIRAMVKLSAVFFHDELLIAKGGGGGYKSAIAPSSFDSLSS